MNPQRLATTVINRRMLVALVMGFSCGLPLLLTLSVLQAWMKEAGVDLTTIGLMSLVGLPYTLKFFWSPVFDRYALPFLGRRRGWLLVSQLALMASLVWLGFNNPAAHPELLALAALAVSFFSASQDIVVDAYRREDLPDRELGLGSSLYINGYRVGMLLASGGGLILADHIPYSLVYLIMALCLLPGVITTVLTPEPRVPSFPVSLKAAVVDPLVEYFSRSHALWILAFILMYKIGDTMAAAMTTPFYLDIGFSKTQIGAVVKLFGFWATVGGTITGGIAMIRLGIVRSLWIFGILQALSTAGFFLLATIGPSLAALSAVIAFENLSGGMGTSAYAAYMASITDKRFTATQYALLTSLMGIPRVLAAAPTGYLATLMGWQGFFIFCTLIAIPGLLLLLRITGRARS
ncbi:MFS transporter [Desulfosarcina alkanivorans]|uniref:MFS transporter n=1 Tax=Desulfosarcina alkanivorans TaxID=571177 RepID=A0A5K7YLS8_9BACT|nr:AmpG family muropeptide MFS transporter [Desulfosarcina alkanivorans]BBO70702.1 MFS transporter [Desulfosarcina alkanivorans]